jgi:hypothetical protein
MGIEVRVERLLWVVEIFFRRQDTAFHEIGFIYLIDVGPAYGPRVQPSFSGVEGPLSLHFRWFPVDALQAERVYPSFLPGALIDLPRSVQHVVHRPQWKPDCLPQGKSCF